MNKIKWSGPMTKSIVKVSSPKGRAVKYVSSFKANGSAIRFTFSKDKKDACVLTRHQVRLVGLQCHGNIVERLPQPALLVPSNLSMGQLLASLKHSEEGES